MFRRRRNDQSDSAPSVEGAVGADEHADAGTDAGVGAAAAPDVRGDVPYDVGEEPQDGLVRLDLGGLRVPGADGMELRLELDEAGETVQAVTVASADSTMQLMAFAAPRTDGIWDDVREEIRKSLAAQGLVDTVQGEFGAELWATLTVAGPQGQTLMQPARFVGIDGPRWFLRALFGGAAARDRAAATPLEAVLRATVVVRGTDPMAPGDPLGLHVPGVLPEGLSRSDDTGRAPLGMPERGPEITEIR